MSCFPDTSFLCALYRTQVNSARADQYMTGLSGSLGNRGQGTISDFDKAKRDPVDWAAVHQRAEALSTAHTISSGHRLADILHVATALHLGVTEFLTFDSNQKKLAQAEGLRALSLSVPLTSIFDFLK